MSQAERPSHFPPLPELYPLTDYAPVPAPVDAGGQAAPAERAAIVNPEPTVPPPAVPARPEKQPYESFTGRVAATPSFRTTTKTQQLVATFPVAVHEAKNDEIITTYHRCVAFGTWAEKVRESLQLGEEIEVHGYKHESTTKAGKPKVEYYVGALRRPRASAE